MEDEHEVCNPEDPTSMSQLDSEHTACVCRNGVHGIATSTQQGV
jgi:hypothetical protein